MEKGTIKKYLINPQFLKLMEITRNTDSLKLTLKDQNIDKNEILTLFAQNDFDWYDLKKNEITYKRKSVNYYQIFKDEKTYYYQFNVCVDRVIGRKYINMLFPWYFKPLGYLVTYFKLPNYKDYLDEMMKDLKDNNINKLIVDLRNNPGGSSEASDMLMYYCNIPDSIKGYSVDQKISKLFIEQNCKNFIPKDSLPYTTYNMSLGNNKDKDYSYFGNLKNNNSAWENTTEIKNKFKGKLLLLTGPFTFSSASDLATVLSDNKQVILVGEPIRQKPTCFGDLLIFNLPKTKIQVAVSSKRFLRPDHSKNNKPTLYPDIEVYPTIEDILEGRDPVFEKALRL